MFYFPSDFFLSFFLFAHKKWSDSGDWLMLAPGDKLTMSGRVVIPVQPLILLLHLLFTLVLLHTSF